MNDYTKEELYAKFSKLPESVKTAIWDLDLDGALGDIGLRHHLYLDKIGLLADETALVMLGLKRPTDLPANLERGLGLPAAQVAPIIADIDREIFTPIRDALRQVHPEDQDKPKSDQDLFAQKMAKLFRVPREEVDLDIDKELEKGGSPDPYRVAPKP